MKDIINFTLLSVRYFCIVIDILEFLRGDVGTLPGNNGIFTGFVYKLFNPGS